MAQRPLRDGVERFSRLAGSAAGQIIEVTRDGGGSRFVDRIAEELGEAAAEIRSLLRGSAWRMSKGEAQQRIDHLLAGQNITEHGVDAFGFDPEYVQKVIPIIEFMYRIYFRAQAFDIDRVPENGRLLLIGNHSGQLPFDAMMVASSLLIDRSPPRTSRAMVEKFVPTLPWFGTFIVRCGSVTGLPENCVRLLEADEAVLVFPEGARGISKPFTQRYQMTQFGHGFMRMALATNTPIVPFAVVGAEEQCINLANLEWLAKIIGSPSVPVPALLPLLGPAAMLPMPVKYRIYFGEPMTFEGDPNDDETVMSRRVGQVRDAIDDMIQRGLTERRGIFV